MNILELLKRKKRLLTKKKETEQKTKINTDSIEIIIENDCNLFKDEKEAIIRNAIMLLENKAADSLEEGIIVSATMFRGLKYKKTEINTNGTITITFLDRSNELMLTK